MNPEISVILPVYNAARTLAEAVESVRAQQCDALEILIVDDGSTDDTPRVIDSLEPGIRRFRQENRGPSSARNLGISQSRGHILAMIDADDLWPEGKLALQLQYLYEDPELQLVTGRIQIVSLDGTPVGAHRFEPDGQLSTTNLGAALFRREAFERVGLFDETLRFSEDQDWFLRARELRLKMLILQETTLIYRRHRGNMTHRKSAKDLLFASVLKKSLDRRRRQGAPGSLPDWSAHDAERKGE